MEQFVRRLVRCALHKQSFASQLLPERVGCSKRVIVEYSSPNIAKPFHIGHLRGTLIGQCIANVQRAAGHQVTSLNWLGDWGTQFGILARGWKEWPDEERLNGQEPISYLHELYVRATMRANFDPEFGKQARQMFQSMEMCDNELLKFWQKCKDISMDNFNQLYQVLNVEFDETHTESMYAQQASALVNDWLQKGIAIESRGAVGVMPSDNNDTDDRSFIALHKSDGSTLYIARDLAAAIDRMHEYNPHRILYVVDNEQSEHFVNMQRALRHAGLHKAADAVEHVKCGRVESMKSRLGKVFYAERLLKLAKKSAIPSVKKNMMISGLTKPEMQSVAQQLGRSAVVVNFLREHRTARYQFNVKTTTATKGDTGMYIQLAHAQLCTLLQRQCATNDIDNVLYTWLSTTTTDNNDVNVLDTANSNVNQLCTVLSAYTDALQRSYEQREPCHLVQYLFKLSRASRSAFVSLKVQGEPEPIQMQRLVLFALVRDVLADCMRLITLTPQVKV